MRQSVPEKAKRGKANVFILHEFRAKDDDLDFLAVFANPRLIAHHYSFVCWGRGDPATESASEKRINRL
jgi:hypothetical protein